MITQVPLCMQGAARDEAGELNKRPDVVGPESKQGFGPNLVGTGPSWEVFEWNYWNWPWGSGVSGQPGAWVKESLYFQRFLWYNFSPLFLSLNSSLSCLKMWLTAWRIPASLPKWASWLFLLLLHIPHSAPLKILRKVWRGCSNSAQSGSRVWKEWQTMFLSEHVWQLM